jgi:hypothetical protein
MAGKEAGMGHRVATWAIVIWTAFMAVAIFLAFLGIGGDCAGLVGSEFSDCQADAWARGGIGLALLVALWFVVVLPFGIWWRVSRPKESLRQAAPR